MAPSPCTLGYPILLYRAYESIIAIAVYSYQRINFPLQSLDRLMAGPRGESVQFVSPGIVRPNQSPTTNFDSASVAIDVLHHLAI